MITKMINHHRKFYCVLFLLINLNFHQVYAQDEKLPYKVNNNPNSIFSKRTMTAGLMPGFGIVKVPGAYTYQLSLSAGAGWFMMDRLQFHGALNYSYQHFSTHKNTPEYQYGLSFWSNYYLFNKRFKPFFGSATSFSNVRYFATNDNTYPYYEKLNEYNDYSDISLSAYIGVNFQISKRISVELNVAETYRIYANQLSNVVCNCYFMYHFKKGKA